MPSPLRAMHVHTWLKNEYSTVNTGNACKGFPGMEGGEVEGVGALLNRYTMVSARGRTNAVSRASAGGAERERCLRYYIYNT